MRFNEGQQKLLDHLRGACLVSASAGCGKTGTIIEKIRLMVQEQGIEPNDIMAISFTRNSAEELVARLEKVGVTGVQVGTFHSICGRILSKTGNFGKEVKRYEVDNLFNKILYSDKPNLMEIWAWISYQKSFAKTPDSEQFEPKVLEHATVGEAKKCFKTYEDYKKKNGMMDMDDVLCKTLQLFQEDKYGYMDGFKVNYLLIDEAQDLSTVQHLLARQLCKGSDIYAIGDEKQSIYGFNGANPAKFLGFKDTFDECNVVHFNVNYRSCQNIIDRANTFCRAFLKSDLYVDSIANNSNEGEITHQHYWDYENEAVEVVRKIKSDIDNGVNPNSIAVLYRLNKMSQLIELELKKANIPYHVEANSSFFKIKEIEAILCVLRLIQNKNDDLAYKTVFDSRLGDFKYMPSSLIKTIDESATKCETSYIHASENIKVPKKDYINRNLRKFADEIDRLHNKSSRSSMYDIVCEAIDLLDIQTCIRTNIYYTDDQKEQKTNALKVLKEFVSTSRDIESLLTFAYSDVKKSKKDEEKNGVRLMSLHKSKGLEWDTVYLISNGRNFPSPKADYREEGNLFYVGITRAKENLHISTVETIPEFVNVTFNDILNNALQEIERFEMGD